MENFLYSTFEVVEGLSTHVDTGEPLPKELWEKLVAARVYMAGSAMLRQLFFGMTDMVLHTRPSASPLPERENEVLSTFFEVAKCAQSLLPPAPRSGCAVDQTSWLAVAQGLHGFATAARGPLSLLLLAHLRRRVRGRLLLVQVGRGALSRCFRRIRGGGKQPLLVYAMALSKHGASSRAAAGCRG